jgi:hypothetical protein
MHGYNGSDGAFVGYSWGFLSVSPCCFKISFVELRHHHVYGVKTKVLSAHDGLSLPRELLHGRASTSFHSSSIGNGNNGLAGL